MSSEYFPFDSLCKSILNLELMFRIIEYCNNTLILQQFWNKWILCFLVSYVGIQLPRKRDDFAEQEYGWRWQNGLFTHFRSGHGCMLCRYKTKIRFSWLMKWVCPLRNSDMFGVTTMMALAASRLIPAVKPLYFYWLCEHIFKMMPWQE